MSLTDLAPANTKRARENAALSFIEILEQEEVTWEYLQQCMLCERAPLALESVIDKFGMHIAFKESRKEQLLARHSVMQYFRRAKSWLLEQFPHHRAVVEKNLL